MFNNSTYYECSVPEYEVPLEIGKQRDQIDEYIDEEDLNGV
ncbi:hypothetical protein [Bacillus sp. AFS041924]|nr:hypothetical protein [Bacillus sp. AFS041924]